MRCGGDDVKHFEEHGKRRVIAPGFLVSALIVFSRVTKRQTSLIHNAFTEPYTFVSRLTYIFERTPH